MRSTIGGVCCQYARRCRVLAILGNNQNRRVFYGLNLPLDAFGCVQIHECVFTAYDEDDSVEFPHAGFWEVVGEPVTIE